MLKKKVQSQKPIEHDIHLKYKCPTCDQHHWLAFREAKTKNFKVVCDCNTVFKVKRISAFKIKYQLENKSFEIEKTKKEVAPPVVAPIVVPPVVAPIVVAPIVVPPVVAPPQIPLELLNKACKLFITYGFTQKESILLLKSSYEKNPVDDYSALIKNTLELIKRK